MGQYCTYDLIKANGEINNIIGSACFHNYWGKFHEFKEMKYYIFKDYKFANTKYNSVSDENYLILMNDQIDQYIKIINRLDNNIKVEYNDKHINGEDCITFTISINNIFLFKCVIMLIRYLHETPLIFGQIPLNIIKINKELRPISLINKIILAHYGNNIKTNNHCLFDKFPQRKLLSKKEYSNIVEINKINVKGVSNQFTFLKNHEDFDPEIMNSLFKENIKKSYCYYKNCLKKKK